MSKEKIEIPKNVKVLITLPKFSREEVMQIATELKKLKIDRIG